MKEETPEKIYKEFVVFSVCKEDPIKWSDVKHFKLEDDDIIECSYSEGVYNSDSMSDPSWDFIVTRQFLETDEEYDMRIKHMDIMEKDLKARRYETYLRLKQEFEN